MTKRVEPDKILMKMPSLRAIRSFVAAAKYQSFTSGAESLCVTQAAISRQIRELESTLGVKLFHRTGRSVKLTEAGNIFYDAAYLSFVNISQASQRIDSQAAKKKEITICCSPAFSSFWLSNHLPDFLALNPDIKIDVITTNSILHLEPGVHPDIFISKIATPIEGYTSIQLFYDIIYPVCSPKYLMDNPEVQDVKNFTGSKLLNLSPYGRSQVAEHIDWGVWMSEFNSKFTFKDEYAFTSNDYNLLIKMAINHQGICLGWHHLVHELVKSKKLKRINNCAVTYKEKCHYLAYNNTRLADLTLIKFKDWIISSLSQEDTSLI